MISIQTSKEKASAMRRLLLVYVFGCVLGMEEGVLEARLMRERAILLAGHVSGQLVAFDAWTGEVINSIDSGGPLVTNCRAEHARNGGLHPRIPKSIAGNSKELTLHHSQWSTDHNFLPNLANGGLFHFAKDERQWKEVKLSPTQLLQAKTPLRARGNPELADVVFLAEKKQKLFTFDAENGQMFPFFSPEEQPIDDSAMRMLLGRVDVTTKMINAMDVMDFKCVTVSEYFVQFASRAQCHKRPTNALINSSPFIDLQVAPAVDGVTTLSVYDPESHDLLWKWDSIDALTMVYGILPQYGTKFYDWSVVDRTPSHDDLACPSPDQPEEFEVIPQIENANNDVVLTTCQASPQSELVIGHVEGQMYLRPTSTGNDEIPKATKQINFTGRRPWQSVVVDGKQGVFISSNSMLWIGVTAVSVVLCFVLFFFWKLKKSKVEPDEPPSPGPMPEHPPQLLKSPRSASFLISPRSPPFLRQRTDEELLPLLLSPGRLQRSVSFGGFPIEQSKWKMPELKLGHRSSTTDDSDASQRSAKSEFASPHHRSSLAGLPPRPPPPTSVNTQIPLTPSNSSTMTDLSLPQPPVSTTTIVLPDELRKILPYICRGRFANEFEELSVLGKGGFGQVILAENRLDGRKYAVKRVGLCLKHQTKETLEKFLREVKILARLDHTYIVRYYQAWLEELGEGDSISLASRSPSASYVSSTRDYSKGNILQRRFSSDEEESHHSCGSTEDGGEEDDDDDDDASHDSLFAPSMHHQNDDDDGFEWERNSQTDDAMEQWSESDLTESAHQPRSLLDTLSTQDERFDHWLYIQMQYCSEQSLADILLNPDRVVVIAQVLEAFFQIASALEHVHSLGLIHRDLKPANIFIMDGQARTIKLGDFGLSRYAGQDGANDRRGPLSWQDPSDEKTAGVGTYLYASPEQISGETYNSKADMYSLGMILFELCHEPFGTSMERIITLRNIREGTLPPNWLLDYPEVVKMIKQLVSPTPNDRPSSKELVAWCLLQKGSKPRRKNVHVLQIEATKIIAQETTMYHNLLLQVCEILRASHPLVVIVACGLKQHRTNGQILEFSLQIDSDDMNDVLHAIMSVEGVAKVDPIN
ncbi:eukaryotic translation initiation factor 2-alpha kinase [Thraustotheca clavata]|uniref:non-specific serine/threonine protein kinase n=1 Tax=Thraustotheca clavata TaxID=74557 RepID=A0A1V9Z7G0_9STRA|nr:eukaryotic translation initiation factor 2-alpha kinase [Thraustotheca clavata]